MGATINGVYVPAVDEVSWDVAMNAGLTVLANAHITAPTLFLSAAEMTHSASTTPSSVAGFPTAILMHSLLNAFSQGVFCTFQLPSTAASGSAVVIRPLWSPSANDGTAHTVRWTMDVKVAHTGLDISTAGTTKSWTGDSLARTQNLSVLETGSSTPVTFQAGDVVRLNLSRIGADALDTYTGNVFLLGVQIAYVNL